MTMDSHYLQSSASLRDWTTRASSVSSISSSSSRRRAGQYITKRRRLPTRRTHPSDDEEDESDGEEDEDEGKELGDRGVAKREFEDETKEAEEAYRGANTEMNPDPDSGPYDDLGFCTELDSDSDFDFECTLISVALDLLYLPSVPRYLAHAILLPRNNITY